MGKLSLDTKILCFFSHHTQRKGAWCHTWGSQPLLLMAARNPEVSPVEVGSEYPIIYQVLSFCLGSFVLGELPEDLLPTECIVGFSFKLATLTSLSRHRHPNHSILPWSSINYSTCASGVSNFDSMVWSSSLRRLWSKFRHVTRHLFVPGNAGWILLTVTSMNIFMGFCTSGG